MSIATVEKQMEQIILDRVLNQLSQLKIEAKKAEHHQLVLREKNSPALKIGTYTFQAQQRILKSEGGKQQLQVFPEANQFNELEVKVEGPAPNEMLSPLDISAVFPPNQSVGSYEDTLPYIMLNRSTLPWEHLAIEGGIDIPWLGLVLLTQEEMSQSNWKKEEGKLRLEVDAQLVPNPLTRQLLTLTIENKAEKQGLDNNEKALIIGHRLPVENTEYTIHLISMAANNVQTIATNRLQVYSLHSWQFRCPPKEKKEQTDFKTQLLKVSKGKLQLPQIQVDTSNKQLENDTQRSKILNTCIQRGYTPMPYFMRRGTSLLAWYRSPLIPINEFHQQTFSYISHPEELLRYHPDSKMVDATYAAAWELGRMLTLKDKHVAVAIYKWKRGMIQQQKAANQKQIGGEKTLKKSPQSITDLEGFKSTIRPWLQGLTNLEAIPFNYLVPYEQMLPMESIRFFNLDRMWLNCLIDGALSIGRVFDLKQKRTDKRTWENPQKATDKKYTAGFLLRSSVVNDFPEMQIVKSSDKNADVTQLPKTALPKLTRKLGTDVMLCLFEEPIAADEYVQLFLKPTGMRLGFEEVKEGNLRKDLKQKDGTQSGEHIQSKKDTNQLIDIKDLVTQLKINSSNQLALQLMLSSPKVLFRS